MKVKNNVLCGLITLHIELFFYLLRKNKYEYFYFVKYNLYMPELPEVRTVVKHMSKRLKNLEVEDIDIRLNKILKGITLSEFKTRLIGKKILNIDNEGKWIIIHFEDDNNVLVHLRLEGKFRTSHVEGVNKQHDHIIFTFTNGSKLYFNDTRQFGTFYLLGKNYMNKKPISKLGRTLKDLDVDWLFNKLSKKRIPIKSSMLDQAIVIGLGNIYINEALWAIKLNPEIPSNKVSKIKLKELIKVSYNIMEESYRMGGSSIATYSSLDGLRGNYQNKLEVHGKKGKPCSVCGILIDKIKVGGRGTYYCPSCQKGEKWRIEQ